MEEKKENETKAYTMDDIKNQQAFVDSHPDSEYTFVPQEYNMTYPDGSVVPFTIMAEFTSEDYTREYMVVQKTADAKEGIISIIPFTGGPEGEVVFRDFEGEEEYEAACERFHALFLDNNDDDDDNLKPLV